MGILSTIKKDVDLVKPIDTIPDQNDPALTAYDTKMEAALAEEQKHTSQASKELENLKTDTMASIDSDQAKQEELVQSGLELQEQKLNNEIDKADKSMQAEKADAYADYQKEIDPYGVNAEYRASQGLNRSGYSESAKVSAFTAYQHRVATARAAFEQAKTEYNIAMEEAKQNANVELANISAKSLQQKLTAAMQFFTMNDSIYNNSLANRINIENHYNTQKNNEWERINKKLAAEEEARRLNLEYRDNKVTRDLQNQLLQREIDAYDQQSNLFIENDGTSSSNEETLPAGNANAVNTFDEYSDDPDLPVNMQDLIDLGLDDESESYIYSLVYNGDIISYEEDGKRRYCLPNTEEGRKVVEKRWKEVRTLQALYEFVRMYGYPYYTTDENGKEILIIDKKATGNDFIQFNNTSPAAAPAAAPANVGNVSKEEYSRILNTPVEERTDLEKRKLKQYLDKAEKETTKKHR
jgi:hypothetical protein